MCSLHRTIRIASRKLHISAPPAFDLSYWKYNVLSIVFFIFLSIPYLFDTRITKVQRVAVLSFHYNIPFCFSVAYATYCFKTINIAEAKHV